MPFGFWVLGNQIGKFEAEGLNLVSNAFRLLGSGERLILGKRERSSFLVSNAFRLLGSGEQRLPQVSATEHFRLKCLSAFGFWGTRGLWHR